MFSETISLLLSVVDVKNAYFEVCFKIVFFSIIGIHYFHSNNNISPSSILQIYFTNSFENDENYNQ